MSYKEFSSAQNAPSKDMPDDKPKVVPAINQLAVTRDDSPAKVAPAPNL